MKKRILPLLLALCMVLSLLPGAALAVSSGTCGDLTWSCSGNTLVISGTGKMCDFERSGPWSGSTLWDSAVTLIVNPGVTYLGSHAFEGMSLESVSLPGTLTGIGVEAFRSTTIQSKELRLPDGLQTIGDRAFTRCMDLQTVSIPDSVTSIGRDAFSNCHSLTDVTLSAALTTIAAGTFYDCNNLENITIPETVQSIGKQAFANSGLTSVTLPNSCTELGDAAFSPCPALTEIQVSADHPAFCSADGVLFSKNHEALLLYPCAKGSSYSVPDGTRSIGRYAFSNCENLTNIVLPDGLTAVENSAFYNCKSLTDVVLPDSVSLLGDSAFYKCESLESVVLPQAITVIEADLFGECRSLVAVVIPEGVTEIRRGAFSVCEALEYISIPDSVTEIGEGAFGLCPKLTRVCMPKALTKIGDSAFSSCGIKTLVIPDGVTEIQLTAFAHCRQLKAVYLPASLTKLGPIAFYFWEIEPRELTDIYFGGTAEQWAALVTPEQQVDFSGITIHYNSKSTDVSDTGFIDGPAAGSWAYPGISYCVDNGLMYGMSDYIFEPNGATTRAQLVAILWRQANCPEATKASTFTDLTQNWYKEAVAWAAENDIVAGRDAAHFDPDAAISRQEVAAIVYRYASWMELDMSKTADITTFPDYSAVSAYARPALAWANAEDIIHGTARQSGVYLDPQGTATRAQIALILTNFCENVAN